MGMLIGLLFLAFMIFLLVAFLRFSVVSDWRTRGAEGRLRYPAPSEVAGIVGFAPPADLVPFFEQALFIERGEFRHTPWIALTAPAVPGISVISLR